MVAVREQLSETGQNGHHELSDSRRKRSVEARALNDYLSSDQWLNIDAKKVSQVGGLTLGTIPVEGSNHKVLFRLDAEGVSRFFDNGEEIIHLKTLYPENAVNALVIECGRPVQDLVEGIKSQVAELPEVNGRSK